MTETPPPEPDDPSGQVPPPSSHPHPGFVHAPQPAYVIGVGTPTKTNGLAVTSMVLGILSLVTCCIGIVLGVLAVVFGAIGLKQINDSNGQQGGKGMAVTGLVCGIIAVAIYGVWYLLALIGVGSAPLTGTV